MCLIVLIKTFKALPVLHIPFSLRLVSFKRSSTSTMSSQYQASKSPQMS